MDAAHRAKQAALTGTSLDPRPLTIPLGCDYPQLETCGQPTSSVAPWPRAHASTGDKTPCRLTPVLCPGSAGDDKNDNRAPSGQEDVRDWICRRIAQHRNRASRAILDSGHRRRLSLPASQSSEQNDRIHPQCEMAEGQPNELRQERDHHAAQEEPNPRLSQSRQEKSVPPRYR